MRSSKSTRRPRGRRRAKLTQRQLWVEYRDETQAQGGTAYSYSRFCALLKEQLAGRDAPTQMHFDYAPGLYGMSDFSGKTLPLRTADGEVDVEIFVALLPCSNLIYAEAVPDQTVCHWDDGASPRDGILRRVPQALDRRQFEVRGDKGGSRGSASQPELPGVRLALRCGDSAGTLDEAVGQGRLRGQLWARFRAEYCCPCATRRSSRSKR